MRQDSAALRWARTAAVIGSAGLGIYVVVYAQLGCDAQTSPAPPEPANASPTPAEPGAAASTTPSPASAAPAEPTPERVEPAAPAPEPAEPEPERAPVFMPASKSGGDFGAVRFPGEPSREQAPTQQTPEPASPR